MEKNCMFLDCGNFVQFQKARVVVKEVGEKNGKLEILDVRNIMIIGKFKSRWRKG